MLQLMQVVFIIYTTILQYVPCDIVCFFLKLECGFVSKAHLHYVHIQNLTKRCEIVYRLLENTINTTCLNKNK